MRLRAHTSGFKRSVAASAILGLAVASAVLAKPGDPLPKPTPGLGAEKVPSRILVFGTGNPIGVISVRPTGAGTQDPWQKLKGGRASGKVRVPTGYDIRLDVDPKFSGDLSLLDSLSAGDLQMVNMADSKITDAALAHLAKFKGLRILNLRKNPITDLGLTHLTGLTAMETLYLDDTQVTDAGLGNLKGMRTLFHLNLGQSTEQADDKPRRIQDAGVGKLAGLTTLVYLDLSGSGVTDEGVKQLRGLQGLYFLNLANTKITESGLVSVAELGGVSDLNISGTVPITAQGVEAILGMRSINQLRVHQGQISTELLTELNARRPGINIKGITP